MQRSVGLFVHTYGTQRGMGGGGGGGVGHTRNPFVSSDHIGLGIHCP